MKRAVALLGLTLVFKTLSAAPGFFPVSESRQLVLQAKESIYRVVLHSSTSLSKFRKSALIPLRESVPNTYSGIDRIWRQFELDHFFGESGGEFFPVTFSTAVLLGDNQTLVTSRHLIEPLASDFPPAFWAARNYSDASEALNDQNLKLVIIDSRGDIVFETRNNRTRGHSATIGFNGHPSFARSLGEPYSDLESETAEDLTDIMEIRLSEPLKGKPLVIATSLAQTGDEVYSLSYPSPTEGRNKLFQVPDSDGKGIRLSKGKVTLPPHFYLEHLAGLKQPPESEKAFLTSRVFSDLDMVGGGSGAPVLNARGEVVALYCAHWPKASDTSFSDALPLEQAYSEAGGLAISGAFLKRALHTSSAQ